MLLFSYLFCPFRPVFIYPLFMEIWDVLLLIFLLILLYQFYVDLGLLTYPKSPLFNPNYFREFLWLMKNEFADYDGDWVVLKVEFSS